MTASYRTSAIKRARRTKTDMEGLRKALASIIEQHQPVTCRQAFYLAVSAGIVEKTEVQYRGTVCRMLADMRREGVIPWHWIVDFTRVMRKPPSFASVEHALRSTATFYRRDLWRSLPVRVEIWSEKESLTGVLYPVTHEYNVPLMPTRGYPSLSFLYAAADEIREAGKPTFIYYFGDHDPSGVDIPRTVDMRLREFAPEAEIIFERLAVLPWQIEEWSLETRPTKRTDTRAKGFEGESVEAEAIAPEFLRDLCRRALYQHIPEDALRIHKVAEDSERALLWQWAGDVA